MTPIIDNWVLIVDSNNYTVARFFGEKTDKNGKTYKDIRDAKYYTTSLRRFVGFVDSWKGKHFHRGSRAL